MSKLQKAISAAMVEAAQGIMIQLETRKIAKELLELPQLIKDQKELVKERQQALQEANDQLAQEEAILMSLITAKLDPGTNKPVYTNKESRDAQLITDKKNSAVYQAALEAWRFAEQKVNGALVELERLQDKFKALRIVANITCKEMALLSLNDEEENNDVY